MTDADVVDVMMNPETYMHLADSDGLELSPGARMILVKGVARKLGPTGRMTTLESFIPALVRDLARLEKRLEMTGGMTVDIPHARD